MPFGGLLTAGLISAGSQLGSGLIGSSAAKKSAKQQREAALYAQSRADQNALKAGLRLDENTDKARAEVTAARGMVNDNTFNANALFDPFTAVGNTATTGLNTALTDPFKFNIQDDPGYAFRSQQGQKAVEQSAAARGGTMSGGTLKALTQYGQGFASQEYQNAFSRHQQQLENLFKGAGLGFNAATSKSNNFNQNSALQVGLTGSDIGILGDASQINTGILGENSRLASDNFTGAGNAQAAGTVGSANALGGAAENVGNTANQLFLYNLLKTPPIIKPGSLDV